MATSPSPAPAPLPAALQGPLDVLMIDNFDSFTWNLYQSFCLLGARVTVVRNDALPVDALPALDIRCLVVSPGPGHPRTDSGVSRAAIRYFSGKVPVLGVCMGLECVVDVFGGEIAYAGEIMHGKLSRVRHDGRGCFKGIAQGIQSTRYHSLAASVTTLPAELQISAVAADSGVIMGVRHRAHTVEAVQYHPESILSEGGARLCKNFLALRGGTWAENPDAGVLDAAPFDAEAEGLPGAGAGADEVDGAGKRKGPSVLEKIYKQRMEDVERAKAAPGTTPADLSTLLSMHLAPPLVDVVARLRQRAPALMAEIKRASPSKGAIAPNANAAQQALTYALAGASVVSVLTEPTWFKGSLLDMRLARAAVDHLPNRPAILRKDFVLDEYQIAEARLHGADTVLLIVAMLPPERLTVLYAYSRSLGMEPVVEVNTAREMDTALALGARIVGVNNRNLHDFSVDMGTTTRLVDATRGRDVVLCALSGISTHEDVCTYAQQGVSAVLIGEALMRATDTRAFIHTLLGWEDTPAPAPPARPLVKICGIRTEAEALAAGEAGADMLGLMFVPSSKRAVDVRQARAIAAAVRAARAAAPDVAGDPEEDTNAPWFALHARRLARARAQAPGAPLLVGVFQDQPLARILDVVARVQLDAVQLHGREPAEWARHIPVPVVRAFHVDAAGRGLEDVTRPGLHQFVLLDAARAGAGLSGGTGTVMDWDLASSVVALGELTVDVSKADGRGTGPVQNAIAPTIGVRVDADVSAARPGGWMPIILAGGLTPENVAEAVAKVRPWAVDVSGGVEVAGGKGKDLDKVRSFIAAAKGLS